MYVHKIYVMIVKCSLTIITNCSEVVNLNNVATNVALVLSEQFLYNWHMVLMRTIMPWVQLNKGP